MGDTALSGHRHDGSLELEILLDSASEDLNGYLLSERRTDNLQEVVQLILLILSSLRRN